MKNYYFQLYFFKYVSIQFGKNKEEFHTKGLFFMPKKKVEKFKTTLSSMQAVTYNRDFKMADRAGGFTDRKGKK